jgi:Uma2 family endonuclease
MTLTDLPGSKYWTYADVQALPEDGNRYEVIDGELIVSPSPIAFHQVVSRRLQFFFYQFELEGRGYIFNAPMDLLMKGCTPVQPDLIFLVGNQFDMIKRNFIEGSPHLIVEVLSPSTARFDRLCRCLRGGLLAEPYAPLAASRPW